MAKNLAQTAASEPDEYPITFNEYLAGFGQKHIESRQAFAQLMKTQGTNGHKPRTEWEALFEMFKSKPTSVPWNEWIKPKKGGK